MKFLIPDSGGIIEKQIISGLEELGHEAEGFYFYPYGADNEKDALKQLVQEKGCEAILGYADDARAALLELCDAHGITLILWHLDAPYNFLKPEHRIAYRYTYHFCMDRYYVKIMKQLGYERVFYLPLATTPATFHPIESCQTISEIGFVGKLEILRAKMVWEGITSVWQGKNEDYLLIRKLIDIASDSGIDVPTTVQILLERGMELAVAIQTVHFLETMAIQYRRRRPIEALSKIFSLRVAGDHWEYTKVRPHQIHARLHYYTELPGFYCSSMINLNVTQPQIKAGLNQRFFDVPACNSFLISDHNEEIGNLFDPEKEIVTYKDITDLIEKAKYYIAHRQEREEIVWAAREKITKCHTMMHRMAKVVDVLKSELPITKGLMERH